MHEVGDVIYLLSRKNHKIVPARVESVTTVKKIVGIVVTHELSIPGGKDQKIVLEKLDVEVFENVKDLRSHLLAVLQEKVDSDISLVNEIVSSTWETNVDDVAQVFKEEPVENKKNELEVVKVQLPDGRTANVQMPQELT